MKSKLAVWLLVLIVLGTGWYLIGSCLAKLVECSAIHLHRMIP
jgi:hypothetical protein